MNPTSSTASGTQEQQFTVLIAEDDAVMRNIMKAGLQQNGFSVRTASDGASALRSFSQLPTDLVILDINMPGLDGYEVCRELRRRTIVPIIIVTAETHIDSVVNGYEIGADAFVTKPFSLNELVLRAQALLRRVEAGKYSGDQRTLRAGAIELDRATHQVRIGNEPVALTPNEYALLSFLMEHPDRPIEKEDLFREIWGYTSEDDANILRVTVRRLRAKIEAAPSNPSHLRTVRGTGYIFVSHPEFSSA